MSFTAHVREDGHSVNVENGGVQTWPRGWITRRARRIWVKLNSSADRSVVFEAGFLLPLVFIGLRTIGLVRVRRLLNRTTTARLRRSVKEARHMADLVEAVARRGPFRYSCLQRSIVLWRVLRRRGLEAELRLGIVRREAGGDRAFHAWVEHAGQVLNDAQHVQRRFSTFGRPREEVSR